MASPNPNNAKVNIVYQPFEEVLCTVPKRVIEDNLSSTKLLNWQLSIGGFLFSGAFWLGVERIYTEGTEDPVLGLCLGSGFCGGLFVVFGYMQAKNKATLLEKYTSLDNPDTGVKE